MTSLAKTTAPSTASTGERSAGRPGFGNVLVAEWVKLISLRSTWLTLGLGVVLSIGMTALMSMAIGGSWESNQDMFSGFNPIIWPLDATLISTIAFSVLGVSVAAGEYTSGMIRLTLMATPRPGSILVAKALVVAGTTAVCGLVAVAGMFVVGQAVYGSYAMPTASLGDPDALQAVLGMGALAAVFPVLGVALGMLLRSTVGAITTALALTFIPGFLGGLFPTWWQEHLISFLPSQAIRAITVGPLMPDDPMYQDPAVAAITLMAWVAAALASAYVVLKKRDA